MKLNIFSLFILFLTGMFVIQSCSQQMPVEKGRDSLRAKQLFEIGLEYRESGNDERFMEYVASALNELEKNGVPQEKLTGDKRYETLANLTHLDPAYKQSLDAEDVKRYIFEATSLEKISTPTSKEKDISEVQKRRPLIISTSMWPYGLVEIRQELMRMLDDWGEASFEVDDTLLQHVTYFYKYYSIVKAEKANRILKRSEKYLPDIIGIYARYKLPEELGFAIPFVESSFNPNARSKVGAVGMFQFMKATAREYGLKVSRHNDERRDYLKAAEASAKYLTRNRMVFSSIVFSIGSYHHGTGGVSSAILSSYSQEMMETANAEERTFGPVFNSKSLGPASREYIPQCLAAALIYRFLKKNNLNSVPVRKYTYELVRDPTDVDFLERDTKNLYMHNPDLIGVDRTYDYYATGGYVLLCEGCKIKTVVKKEKTVASKKPGRTTGKKVVKKSGGGITPKKVTKKVSGNSKFIRYMFQEGNSFEWLASTFGTTIQKIKRSPENRYLTKRDPRPGDIIRIDGLAPTTQKIGGGGYLCGKQLTFQTRKDETLKEVDQRARSLIRENCPDSKWQLGQDFSPELIKKWNTLLVGDVSTSSPLEKGLPLVIYSDYLGKNIPKSKSAGVAIRSGKNVTSGRVSTSKRRTGSKYISYIVQDKNIAEGDVAGSVSRIFHLKKVDLIAWNSTNSFLRGDVSSPLNWPASHRKIYIKNCPDTTQKFGGVVCGRSFRNSDTRYTLKKGQTLNQAVNSIRKYLQSSACKVEGKGVTSENILYWNADALKTAGITGANDPAERNVKLIVYSDYY